MKQHWAAQELLDLWILTDTEKAFASHYHTGPNQVACALLLKCYQRNGRFPQRKVDIPPLIIEHVSSQLSLKPEIFNA